MYSSPHRSPDYSADRSSETALSQAARPAGRCYGVSGRRSPNGHPGGRSSPGRKKRGVAIIIAPICNTYDDSCYRITSVSCMPPLRRTKTWRRSPSAWRIR